MGCAMCADSTEVEETRRTLSDYMVEEGMHPEKTKLPHTSFEAVTVPKH